MTEFLEYSKERSDLALLDNDFLVALQTQKQREIYARVTSLNIDELPIDSIEGRVTGGSINIDGSSAVRRTCNLTMVAEDIDINDVYWGTKTKIKIEIGLKNTLQNEYKASNKTYPSIVWFPQGVYYLTAFNTSVQVKGYTISLTGKDKMCMLNGELGGQLFASIDFGKEEFAKKVFKPIVRSEGNSETFLGGKYYFKPDITELPDIIVETDEQFSFTQESEGDYYKINNTYVKIKGQPLDTKSKFKVYQKAMAPYQIFKKVVFTDDNPYEKNQYYYQKKNDKDYYVLNMTKTPKDNNNFEIVELYEIDVEYTKTSVPIERIIREAVHAYAKEPYHNIIINDLDKYGLEQLTYNNEDEPIYGLYDYDAGGFVQLFFERNFANEPVSWGDLGDEENWVEMSFSQMLEDIHFKYVMLSEINDSYSGYSHFKFNVEDSTELEGSVNYIQNHIPTDGYGVAKFVAGDDIGYRITDLTYTGDLISNVGETLTSVLDKIKTMLGEFEYFYDVEGRFIFQKKKTFVNTSWDQISESDDDIFVDVMKTKFAFNFENNNLITAIQNSPVLTNLKNDFSVWGKRKGISGAEIPIHARYAIDKKPKVYKAFNGITYYTKEALNDENISLNTQANVLQNWVKNEDIIPEVLKNSTPNEDGYYSDWYELKNWAEKYKLLTGTYPKQKLYYYGTTGFKGSLTFANGQTRNFNRGAGQLIIDFDSSQNPMVPLVPAKRITIVNNIPQTTQIIWRPFQHGFNGCGHTYEEFLNFYDTIENFISFIYKPAIPEPEIVARDGGTFITDDAHSKLVDWRELIYQMALDYFAAQGCDKSSFEYKKIYDLDGNLVLDDVDRFLSTVAKLNPDYYPSGYTGYEQYYTDMQGFWRELYNPDYVPVPEFKLGEYTTETVTSETDYFQTRVKTWKDAESLLEQTGVLNSSWVYYLNNKTLFKDGINNIEINPNTRIPYRYYHVYEKIINDGVIEKGPESYVLEYNSNNVIVDSDEGQYYHNLKNDSYIKLYIKIRGINQYQIDYFFSDDNDLVKSQRNELTLGYNNKKIDKEIYDNYEKYFISFSDLYNDRKYWNKNVFENPEILNFWIEFLDNGNELAQFSVPVVGDRSSSINEDKASSIVFKDIPQLILYPNNESANKLGWQFSSDKIDTYLQDQTGYIPVWLPPGLESLFQISYKSLSVKNKVDEMLYKYAYCIENITLTALPIYHLQPNTVIYVQDETTHIEGEYIINKITLPLDYKGTMSISAVKAPQRIY